MATSSTFPVSLKFPFFLLLLALTPLAYATFPSSSVASTQLEFWSKNVLNIMPKTVVSKLSPLSKQDSDSLAAFVTKPSFSPDVKFCSIANLVCESKSGDRSSSRNLYDEYVKYQGRASSTADASDEADPNSFFRRSILQKGNKVHLPNLNDRILSRSFLPTQIASKISITSANDLQKLFPELFSSPATKEAIEMSIFYCTAPNLKGEIKSCPKSLEDMIEFSTKVLGKKKLFALTSKSTKGSAKELEIGSIKQFHAEKVVSCHEIFFPFATYFCHLLSSTRLYAVDFVEPTTKAPVNRILGICHMDTSEWPAEHVAFKILKFSPGQGEACHWFTQIDLVWMGNGDN